MQPSVLRSHLGASEKKKNTFSGFYLVNVTGDLII